jgi:hypothetical protein
MEVLDVVIGPDTKRHIIYKMGRVWALTVCVRTGTQGKYKLEELRYFKKCDVEDFIMAYECSRGEVRDILKGLTIAKEAFKVYTHRGDDIPSIFFR